MTKGIPVGLLVLLVGCATEREEAPTSRIDLRASMHVTDAGPVGAAVGPDGTRFMFDEDRGLYRIEGDQLISIMTLAQLPTPDKQLQFPITDIVSLAPNLFAMTAIGDGFLLDTAANTLTQHFCYFPAGDGGGGTPVSISQRTDAIAYDAVAQKIYAQPLTYDAAYEFQYAQVARYNRATGVDEAWFDAPPSTLATGSAFVPDVGLVLGQGSELSRFDLDTREMIVLDDLSRFGVRSIDGLAIDPVTNSLIVADKVSDSVFDIDLARISL